MKICRGVKSAVICGALGTGLSSLLAGCASVTAIPLEADGLNAVPGAQPGFRYYIPRPYLLVAEAPAAKAGGGSGGTKSQPGLCKDEKKGIMLPCKKDQKPDTPPGAVGAAPPAEKKTDAAQTKTPAPDTGGSPAAPGPAADISFQFGDGKTYIAKLVYLPDYSRPMAVELNTGLVGISHVDMTLQDGWMLTSVSANADNSKMADVLTAAIQALSAGGTGGTSAAASKAKTASNKVGGEEPLAPKDRSLRPGLYAFDYNYGMSRVSALCAVAYFGPNGSTPARGAGACYSRPMPPIVSARY
jgi:hypothetical protein